MSDYTSPYWERVRTRADELGSDGCTKATNAFRDCCLEHDIAYRTGHTIDGEPQNKQQADLRFRACMQRHSTFGWFSPMAWWRYLAVKWRGKPSYREKPA